jgi:hypothetical protein
VHKDIRGVIRIAGNKGAGPRLKGYGTAVSRNRWPTRVTIPLRSIGSHRDAAGLPRLPVVDEDVAHVIGIAGNQVAGPRGKGHETAVGRNSWRPGIVIRLRPVGSDRDATGLPRLPVVDEDVPRPIVIGGNQIAGPRFKSNVTAVGRDRCVPGFTVRLHSVSSHRDAAGLPRLPVVDEDVAHVIGIAGNQVAGLRGKGQETAVDRDGWAPGMTVPLRSVGSDRDATRFGQGGNCLGSGRANPRASRAERDGRPFFWV